MGRVAVRTLDLSLLDGVVRLLVDLAAHLLVAGETELRLRCLQTIAAPCVARMTIAAGDASGGVSPHPPGIEGLGILVAPQTDSRLLLRRLTLRKGYESACALSASLFDVDAPGPVTGLAAV